MSNTTTPTEWDCGGLRFAVSFRGPGATLRVSGRVDGADAFAEIARDVVRLYPDRRIGVTRMLALGSGAVAVQGDWDGTAATATPTGAKAGDAVHHDESMLIELVDGRITLMRIYR